MLSFIPGVRKEIRPLITRDFHETVQWSTISTPLTQGLFSFLSLLVLPIFKPEPPIRLDSNSGPKRRINDTLEPVMNWRNPKSKDFTPVTIVNEVVQRRS